MKSSALKFFLIVALVSIPLLVWSIVTQPQDVRSRADNSVVPTATPSATLTPTMTLTPSLTPTPTNSPPICLGLSANPGAGSKPMTVNFSCAAYDGNNDVTAAEFGFGAGEKLLVEKNVGQYGAFTATFTYTTAGTYHVTCRVRDNNNAFSDYPSFCTYTVVVSENAMTPTPIRTPAPTKAVPQNAMDEAPIIFSGDNDITTFPPAPTDTPMLVAPSPTPKSPTWWTNEKIKQIGIMVGVSAVTILAAFALHSFFDKP